MPLHKKKLEFEIVFDVYIDDHYNRTFKADERKWILKKQNLIYQIDAHNKRYADTLKLFTKDIDTLVKLVKENNFLNIIKKNLSKDYLDKYEWTATTIGKIYCNNKLANFNVKSNSSSALDEDKDYKNLKKLEDKLYQIIATYKN